MLAAGARGLAQGEGDEGAPSAQAEAPDEPSSPGDEDLYLRATPRGTVTGFLARARERDWAGAARYLHFDALQRGRRAAGEGELSASEREALARQLFVVLQRHVRLDLPAFSDALTGDLGDSARANVERIGTVQRKSEPDFDILLTSIREGEERVWLFSESTVAKVPELYMQRGYGWIEELLPSYFFEVRFLTLELWQWIALLLLVVVSSAIGWLATFVLFRALRSMLRAQEGEMRDKVLTAVAGPLRLALSIAVFYAGTASLYLAPAASDFFGTAAEVLTLFAVTWFLMRCVDIAGALVSRHLAHRDLYAARTLVPMGRRVTKVLVAGVAFVSLIHNLGFSVTGIVTTLGVGGLAVALAAQKPLENLFGAVTVLMDQPVKVGDYCRVGEHAGTVEDIGLRSTRLRTADRSVLHIPNAEFASARIENFAKRDQILLSTIVHVGYDTTPDQMRYLLVEIRRMLYAHPRTLPDPCRVRFVGFGPYSLDVELFVYAHTGDGEEFLAIKEDIYLRIMDVVAASGARLALPSQTLYLGRDEARDGELAKVAEQRVREWRERGELPLPEFTHEEIRALDDTLAFPERGSSSSREADAATRRGNHDASTATRRRSKWRRREGGQDPSATS